MQNSHEESSFSASLNEQFGFCWVLEFYPPLIKEPTVWYQKMLANFSHSAKKNFICEQNIRSFSVCRQINKQTNAFRDYLQSAMWRGRRVIHVIYTIGFIKRPQFEIHYSWMQTTKPVSIHYSNRSGSSINWPT